MTDKPDRQTQAVVEDALNRARNRNYTDEHIAGYLASPQYTGWTTFVAIIEQLQREKQAAIAASDAKYVPMLVEALQEILCCHDGNQPEALNMPDLQYARWTIAAIHRLARAALSQLPEDLR